jgi:hypothetical protein
VINATGKTQVVCKVSVVICDASEDKTHKCEL